jgi:hypothetical protein
LYVAPFSGIKKFTSATGPVALAAGIRDDSEMVKMTRAFVSAGHLMNRIVPSENTLDSVEREVVWKRLEEKWANRGD